MANMACTVKEWNSHPWIAKLVFTWLSDDAAGTASAVTVNSYTGKITRLITDPGSVAPTDNYDVTLLDEDSMDVLMGAGLNRDTANTEQVLASSLGCCLDSKLTLNIAAAGNAKDGVVYVYIEKFAGIRF